jgi:RHS repeat-associated protein
LTNCSRAGAGAGFNYPFLTLKERDIETDLDYFLARYYSAAQGRFTSNDPYNIILEVEASADISAQKARVKLIAYLSQPQQWNRYAYTINNPLKYIDPTGETVWLTGSEQEQKAALERIKNMLGSGLFKYVKTEVMDTHVGRVTVVSYDAHSNGDALARLGGDFGVYMAQILESSRVTEFRIATGFSDKSGRHSTREFGGAATVATEESFTGNTQIFVHPDAAAITQEAMSSLLGRSKSSDGKPLDFFNDIDDAHEFGHAFANMIYKVSVNSDISNQTSLRFENLIRERRGLPNRRKAH